MKTLFDPVTIGKIPLKNRVVRSATMEAAQGRDGFSEELCRIYGDLARGNVAAIITGMIGVDENSRLFPKMVDSQAKDFVPEMKKVTDLVHESGCKLIAQISHCGLQARVLGTADCPLAPSETEIQGMHTRTKAMTGEDIAKVAEAFARTATRCREAGADGVQIHGAHGYLLSQFLTPYFNRRSDEYGGGIEGRGRIVLEVLDAVRKTVGPDFAVWIKINCTDGPDLSTTEEEFQTFCKELEKKGIDAIEVSGGLGIGKQSTPSPVIRKENEEGVFAGQALALAGIVKTPVISVGGYRTLSRLEEWLNKGNISAIAMSRPLISEPDLARRWQDGNLEKARCISCNKCFTPKGRFGCQAFDTGGES